MIKQLSLLQFKCFEHLDLPLAPLTVLSGLNASGKSSILHALVLLHQTMRNHEWSTRIMLNGYGANLGTVADVVDKLNGRYSFRLGITGEDATLEWTFDGERVEQSMRVSRVSVGDIDEDDPSHLRFLLPHDIEASGAELARRVRDLTYIGAERIGPREFYPLEDKQNAPVVGPSGEHAVSVLYWAQDERILDGLVLPDAPPTLLRQTEAMLQRFFARCGLDVQRVPQANLVTLGIRNSEDTDFNRPINSGFGITQVLPIIVAALSARANDILLIENPEVHLHPAGQALMGEFLAKVAKEGLQVVVETHSDHVLNGIRRAVKGDIAAPDDIAIYFFRPRGGGVAQVVRPLLDASGNIDVWPEGFFDQFDKDMSYFAGWGS